MLVSCGVFFFSAHELLKALENFNLLLGGNCWGVYIVSEDLKKSKEICMLHLFLGGPLFGASWNLAWKGSFSITTPICKSTHHSSQMNQNQLKSKPSWWHHTNETTSFVSTSFNWFLMFRYTVLMISTMFMIFSHNYCLSHQFSLLFAYFSTLVDVGRSWQMLPSGCFT